MIKDRDQNKDTYRLDNLGCCAFLLLQEGIELLGIEEDRYHHFIFNLSNPQECAEFRKQFLNGGLVSAIDLLSKRELLINEIKAKSKSSKGGIHE